MEASRQPPSGFQKSLEAITDPDGYPLFEGGETFGNPSSKSRSTSGLTQDESAALSFYTTRDSPDAGFYLLQDALASENKLKTRSWSQYLNLFMRALQKLDAVQAEFYQCIPFRQDLCVHYVRATPLYTGLCSVTPEEQVAGDHFEQNFGNQRRMLLVYENAIAYNISRYSSNGYDEYVTWPGQQLMIRKIEESYAVTIVYLTGGLSESSMDFKSR